MNSNHNHLDLYDIHQTSEVKKVEEDLEAIVKKLSSEKNSLQMENKELLERLKNLEEVLRHKNEIMSGQRESMDNEVVFQRMNERIVALQSELNKSEEQKEDYRMNAEIRDKEVMKLRQQLDQLSQRLNEFKRDRDELDRLRYLNEEVERFKSKEEVHRRKIEELKEAKRQLVAIEERNVLLTKRICELEDETKRLSLLKGQIDMYKKQKEDLRLKVGEEGYRADRAEEENKRLSKKLEELIQEKDKHLNEVNNLRHELNHFKTTNTVSVDNDYPNIDHSVDFLKANSEDKEKVIRLEFENNKLKEKLLKSDDERVKLLETQLEDEKVRVNDLENENRLIKQKLIRLETQMKDNAVVGSDDDQMQTFQDIIKQKEMSLDNTKQELMDAQHTIDSLNAIIAQKDQELNEKEDQYKKYVAKAKTTLDQLSHQSINSSSINSSSDVSNDINYWKQLVVQKDEEINRIKADFEESNSFKEMENRLMTISFHNLV